MENVGQRISFKYFALLPNTSAVLVIFLCGGFEVKNYFVFFLNRLKKDSGRKANVPVINCGPEV